MFTPVKYVIRMKRMVGDLWLDVVVDLERQDT